MFFKKIKQTLTLTLLSIFIIPINVLAYSKFLIVGGENIGITVSSNGIIVVGTYEVDGDDIALKSGIKKGDIIKTINNKKVTNIEEMVREINNNKYNKVKIEYLHNNKLTSTNLKLIKKDDIYKTGLYVKDSISGIGTLTYIDKETNMYGALGHEITESTTGIMLEVKDGKIYNSNVTSIDKSEIGSPGSKNATLNTNSISGNILKNTESGIFGKYTSNYNNKKEYKVASKDDIKNGKAKILTVLEGNNIKEYNINIKKLNLTSSSKIKRMLFEVTDDELIEKTGGIVQGMSGSPIIQGDYIVGAVTSVVVTNPKEGYGIIITDMLEEMEKE